MLAHMDTVHYIAGNIRLENLDDFSACFSRDTGATIVLDALTAMVATIILESGQASQEEITHALSPYFKDSSIAAPEAVIKAMERLLSEKLVTIAK